MKIMEFLCEKAVSADLKAVDKKGVIEELVELLLEAGEIKEKDKQKIIEIILNRESLGSTGVGQGIAIPHGKSDCVKTLTASLGISKRGINFDALDGEPVYIFFLLLAPKDSAGPHLKALARISRILKDKYLRDSLIKAEDEKKILSIIREEDEKKF
ncbi:MAG: PTS sugar transporter subunit IIA [Candidatus Omnitrophica bacterium]|nr:PTS sugar transporter subunit IIA [Candidatus Omnitrophota bacterium]MCM8793379.1 PTS sugar transporter subunit IIA [Candidatus Omnitrophota bacterium]